MTSSPPSAEQTATLLSVENLVKAFPGQRSLR